jgi:hypothetical protein
MDYLVDFERNARADAEEKARRLVCLVLPADLWNSLERQGSIVLTGERNVYVVSPTAQTEIRDRANGRLIAHACLQLTVVAPCYDRFLAEYLLLKNNEDLYWRTANVFSECRNAAIPLLLFLDLVLLGYLLISIANTL